MNLRSIGLRDRILSALKTKLKGMNENTFKFM